MKTETKLTIDDMIARAVDDRLYMEAMDQGERSYMRGETLVIECPPPVRFLPGTALSHGLASVEKQSSQEGSGIFWLLTAIATWVAVGGDDMTEDGYHRADIFVGDDGFDEAAYAEVCLRSESMEHAQFFTLQKRGADGAELCVSDGNCPMRPIQRWDYSNFPWGCGPFNVWAFRERVGRSRVWTLMLPAEY
jgi:hypothetical protein